MELKEGAAAPAFELTTDEGSTVRLANFKGHNVVLYFFPKALTPGWTIEAREFRAARDSLARKNAIILGCSADKPETLARFKKKHKLNFTLLSDPEKGMLKDYGVWRQKSFLGKKFMGIVRTTVLIGKDGNVKKVFEPVRPGKHAPEVLAALEVPSSKPS